MISKMKNKKIDNPLVDYENKWVALNEDKKKVVESAQSLGALNNKLDKSKRNDVVITKVLPFDVLIAPNVEAKV